MHLMDDNSTLAHLGHELPVILLRLLDPEDVVKEQFPAITRSESAMR